MLLALRSAAVLLSFITPLFGQATEASKYLAEQDWPAAKATFERALKAAPRNADLHIGLGVALWGMGERTSALHSFEQAVRLDPRSAEAHFNKGIALRGLERMDEARHALETAIRLKPDHERARITLGLLYQQTGKLDAAIEQYREALKHNASSADAYNWLGVALQARNLATEAIEAFRKAVQLEPKHVRAWNNLGAALAHAGNLPQAIEAFEAGLQHAPADQELLVNYGISLRNQGDAERALKQFRTVVEQSGPTADLHFQIAQTLRQAGKVAESIEAFDAALSLNPELAEAYYALGGALRQQASAKRPRGSAFARHAPAAEGQAMRQATEAIARNDWANAAAILAAAVAANPQNAEAYSLLAFVEGRRGRLDAALSSADRALQLKPDLSQAHYHRGLTLWYTGNSTEARAALDQAIAFDGGSGEAYAFRGHMKRHASDLEGARKDLQFAIALAPRLPAPYVDLGIVFLRLGRIEHGLGQLEAALNLPGRSGRLPDVDAAAVEVRAAAERQPPTPELHNTLGRLLGAAGADAEQVKAAFQAAVHLKPDYAQAWNNLGLVHVQAGDDAQAIAAFRTALKLRPDYADAHSNLGAILTSTDVDGAIVHLERAVRLEPALVKAHYNLGLAYGASEAHGTAREIEQHRKVLELDPSFPRAHFALGRALLRSGDAAAAIVALHQATQLESEYGEAHYQLGLALARAGRKEEANAALQKGRQLVAAEERRKNAAFDLSEGRKALEAGDAAAAVAKFRQIVQAQPDAAEAQHYLGLALARQGDAAGAASAFSKALELDPAHPTARLNLASVAPSKKLVTPQENDQRAEVEQLIREKRFTDLEPVLRKMLQERPNWAWGWYALGYASFAQQRLGESIKALARSLELDVANAEAHNLLGRNLMMVGRFDGAQVEFQQAAKLNPQMAEARYNLGQLFSIQDNWADARRELEEAVRIRPDYAEAHNALGFAMEGLGEDEAAVASYRKAIALSEAKLSANPAPYVNLSAYYNKTQDPESALQFAQKALSVNPQSDAAWFQVGRAHQRKGEDAAAKDAIAKAIAINPRVATYHYVVATLYRRLGHTDESRTAMERFRQLERDSNELERRRREALRAGGTLP